MTRRELAVQIVKFHTLSHISTPCDDGSNINMIRPIGGFIKRQDLFMAIRHQFREKKGEKYKIS